MTRRIFRSVVSIAMFSVLLAAVLTVLSLFDAYENDMIAELRTEARYIQYAVQQSESEADFFRGFPAENRVTLIAQEGTVLYDSQADAGELDNHAQRPEVVNALENGWGESQRYSDTLAETTYYYAVRTRAGNVLRVANTRSSMLGMLLQAMPVLCGFVLLVGILSLVIARFAAMRIVAPINSLNLDDPLGNEIYDELSPLLTRMDKQRREIELQMRQLDAAQRELNAITRNMREGLIIIDSRGTVLTMNESAARVFDVDADERIGRDLFSLGGNDAMRDAVAAAQRGVSGDITIERGGRYYRLLANPVSRSGKKAGVVLLAVDVTDRYTAELNRREFTANVSHELKTPLTSISGYAEIIREGVARAEDVAGFASRIHSEASHLLSLINDILELARLDERRGLGEKETLSLQEIAAKAAARMEKPAREKNIDLKVDGGDAIIRGHAVLLGEMIFNLLDNAVKYTPEGGKVHVAVVPKGAYALVSVQDNGIGIPRVHQEHIFERFYRVDKSHSRSTGGTGLGLAIVKHGAQIHNADISLRSEEGRGTCVELRFMRQ